MSTSVRYAGLRALLQAPLRALTTQDEFEIMLAFKVTIHATTPGAPPNTARSHHRIAVSVPVTYATKDQIVLDLMGEFTASTEKGAKSSALHSCAELCTLLLLQRTAVPSTRRETSAAGSDYAAKWG